MKRFVLLTFLAFSTVHTLPQGVLIFNNSLTTGITNGVTGLPAPGFALDQTDTQVGLYIGNIGAPVSSLTIVATTNLINPGQFRGGIRAIPGWGPGVTVQLQVRAWLAATVYLTYEAAHAAALGGDGTVLIGVSAPFSLTLGDSGTPSNIANAMSAFTIEPVPEPSTAVLGLLGLAMLALFRRRA